MEGASWEERMLSALAHMGMFMPGWGLVGAVVIWITGKSTYVRHHGRQAVAWQMTYAILMAILLILMLASFAAIFLLMPGHLESDSPGHGTYEIEEPGLAPVVPFAIVGLAGILWVTFIITSLVGAVKAWTGRTFRYPLVGKILEKRAQE